MGYDASLHDEDGDRVDEELRALQVQLVRLLAWVQAEGRRVAILFEGRDTAGKGGAIFNFTRFLNPKATRIIALSPPTEMERGQWYFQRYLTRLPNRGEITFWDRSWYNRAGVEPVMGFCTPEQHERFLEQVPQVEKMLVDDGIDLVKFWFSIDAQEQQRRLRDRAEDDLKRWKLSTVDGLAQQKWDDFTRFKEEMFRRTHRPHAPWVVVNGNDKRRARLEAIRYVLSCFDYEGRDLATVRTEPDPAIVKLISS
jgi:polyphosphate kinase